MRRLGRCLLGGGENALLYVAGNGGGRDLNAVVVTVVVFSAGTCSTEPFPCSPFSLFSSTIKQSCSRCVTRKRKCVASSIIGVCEKCLIYQTKKSRKVSGEDPPFWVTCSFNPSFHPGRRTDLKGAREALSTKLVVQTTSCNKVRDGIEIT